MMMMIMMILIISVKISVTITIIINVEENDVVNNDKIINNLFLILVVHFPL